MAPVTSFNFMMLAAGLLLLDRPNRQRESQLLALPVGITSFISLCGYLYGASSLNAVGPFVSVAIPTAIAFQMSVVALFGARPNDGPMGLAASDTLAGTLLRRLLPAILAIPVTLAWLCLRGQEEGLYDNIFGVAILTTGSVGLLTAVLWSVATSLDSSERRRRESEQALQLSEAKYRDLYENLPDMCATVDYDTEIVVDCNETLAEKLGYSKAEIIGYPLANLYHSLGDPLRRGFREALQKTGAMHDVERMLKCKDGTALDSAMSVTLQQGAGGRRFGKGVWRDMSNRRQAERDVIFLAELGELWRQSSDAVDLVFKVAERLGDHLHVTRAAFFEVDADRGRITITRDFHGNLSSMAGTIPISAYGAELAAEQRAGKLVALASCTDDPRTAPRLSVRFEPFGIRSFVSAPLVRDGKWVASLVVGDSVPRAWTGREVALLQTVAERTWLWVEHIRLTAALREKEAQEILRGSEERFRLLVSGVKEYAIFQLDAAGHVISWNEGARQIKGYEEAEILGKHFSLFYTEEDRQAGHPAENLARAASEGRCEEEGWRVRKDGTRFWANVLLTGLREKGGNLRGFAKVTRDFTERRRAEELLRQNQAQLAESLKEREVLLQEVHHRVKNNLQVISSLINMQARQMTDQASRGALEECKTRVEAIALIHEKLYQSKDYAQVPFSDYARGLAQNIFHSAGVSRSVIDLQVDIEGMALAVDKAIPCGLILNELITNALKHAFPDDRRGVVRVELRKEGAGDVLLAVGDDGVGVPPNFEPSRSPTLGLQLIATLVKQLDGKLQVLNTGGTTFKIVFPMAGSA
jgi:PAS domain S-box-containing protein